MRKRNVPYTHNPHSIPPYRYTLTTKHALGEPEQSPPIARRALRKYYHCLTTGFGFFPDLLERSCASRGDIIRGGGVSGKNNQAQERDSVEPRERCGGHRERFESRRASTGVSPSRGCQRRRTGGFGSNRENKDWVESVAKMTVEGRS